MHCSLVSELSKDGKVKHMVKICLLYNNALQIPDIHGHTEGKNYQGELRRADIYDGSYEKEDGNTKDVERGLRRTEINEESVDVDKAKSKTRCVEEIWKDVTA